MNEIKCIVCGSQNNENEKTCRVCGTSLNTNCEEIIKVKKVRTPRHIDNDKIPFIIKNAIICILSLMLLILAFLPIYSAELDLGKTHGSNIDGNIQIKINTTDAIMLWFDSLQELNDQEIANSDISIQAAEMIADIKQEIFNKYGAFSNNMKLNSSQEAKMSQFLKLTLRSALQSEKTNTSGYMTIAMILSFTYIVLCIAAFIISVINLINIIRCKKSFFTLALKVILSIPIVLTMLLLCITPYTAGSVYSYKSLSFSAILSICLILASSIYLFVDRMIHSGNIGASVIVKNAISLACALCIIAMAFAPVVTTNISTRFSGNINAKTASLPLPAEYFAYLDKNEDSEIFKDMNIFDSDTIFDSFSNYTKTDICSGSADAINYPFLSRLMSAVLNYGLLSKFPLLFYAFIFIIACAGIVANQNIIYFCIGKKNTRIVLSVKIICVIAAIAILVGVILLCVVSNFASNEFLLEDKYNISIAFGPIVMLVLSIFAVCIPSKDKNIRYIMQNEAEKAGDDHNDSQIE